MTLTPFETNLYRQLNGFFHEQQFVLLADKKQYRKTIGSVGTATPLATATVGFQNVILSPAFYPDETWLEVNFGCRNEQVEQIAQQFLNNLPDFRPDANTLIVSIGKFTNRQYFRYKIRTPDDLTDVCQQIQAFFVAEGFAFMEASYTLPALDQLFNQQPNQPCRYVYNQVHRCYKGLIAARLHYNPHFSGLVDSYRHVISRLTHSSHEQLNFERLITYLTHYSAN